MNKSQALNSFWNGFDIPAYDSQTVPPNATLPYITYETITDNFDNRVTLSASVWYQSTSWEDITDKVDEVAERLGYGGEVISIDGGYVWLMRGTPFAQRMSDPDDTIRRIVLNVMAEYLTAI